MRYILLCTILTSLLFSCTKKENVHTWQKLNLKLNTVFELPDTTSSNSEIFFFHPDFIVTDSTGNIIIAERSINKLFVFNEKGQFLHEIGGRGRGPSEFLNINGMSINNSDEILVFDQSSQVIKKFTTAGEYINSISLKTAITDIEFEFWGDYILLFYLNDFPADYKENYLIHTYSSNGEKENEFVNFNSFEGLNKDLLISYISLKSKSHFVKDNSLYLTPTLYNGFVYSYDLKNKPNGFQIQIKKKIKGFIKKKEPAERFDGDNLEYSDASVTMAGGRKFQYLFYNQSKGFFQLNNGLIIHFTFITDEENQKRIFGAELYDADLNPLGYANFNEISFDPARSNLLSWNVMWKDNQDRFYIVDKDRFGQPNIRVVTIKGLNSLKDIHSVE